MMKKRLLALFSIFVIGAAVFIFKNTQIKNPPLSTDPISTYPFPTDVDLPISRGPHQTEEEKIAERENKRATEVWALQPGELESAILQRAPKLSNTLQLKRIHPTRLGYRATPTIDGVEIFGQHAEFRKRDGVIQLFWRELPKLRDHQAGFPQADHAIFEKKILEYFSLKDSCETPKISQTQKYWYMRDAGKLVPALSLRVSVLCRQPREQKDETWLYSLEDNEVLKVTSKN